VRPNWFLGFPIDGSFLLSLPEMPSALRRFHVDDVHLTLAFLGGVGEQGAACALAALDERLRISPLPSFEISLGGICPMGGSRRHYTALSALLADGRDRAAAVIAAYRDALTEAASGRRDPRPPKPHVTLARPKRRATDADRELGLAWAASVDLRGVRARLDRIALYTWSEVRRERMFRIVEERAVAGGRGDHEERLG
jgi:2'-5' RNA ligase